MGKRQIIYRREKIAGNQELLDREVNLVTSEDRVWHGRIVAVGSSDVELKDARSGKHRFSLAEVDRIYCDVTTDY
ncbi:MAG: hypothetical protein WCH05_07140 [Chlorobiaceae bacterium]